MESFTTQDLIKELREHYPLVTPRREGGVTVREWADEQGIGYAAANKQLRNLEEEGVVVCEVNRCGNVNSRVFYRNESK